MTICFGLVLGQEIAVCAIFNPQINGALVQFEFSCWLEQTWDTNLQNFMTEFGLKETVSDLFKLLLSSSEIARQLELKV